LHGGATRFIRADVRGRPKFCTGVFIQPRGVDTALTTSENLPASDLIFAYDRAVAHELLHAVGAEHHGKKDYSMGFRLLFPDDPRNQSGKPQFILEYSSVATVITITDEASGQDLAAKLAPDLMLAREASRPAAFAPFKANLKRDIAKFGRSTTGPWARFSDDQIVDVWFNDQFGNFYWYVGAQKGESAGDEDCVMRYYFAQLYEKAGTANAYYYLSQKPAERAGLGLCVALTGTGINDSARKPQPRYGDASSGWAKCAEWIVFNDGAPVEPAPK
jgi:hypothetical protein